MISDSRFLDEVRQDMRLACRTFRATPIVAFVAAASLALGIGANTAIFSVINSLLLRQLPVQDPSRLVLLTDASYDHVRAWSYPIWAEIHRRPDLFARSAAWSFTRFNLAAGGETQFVEGLWASGTFFETLGVPALVGRTFSDADDTRNGGRAGPVAVISYACWQARFGGTPDVVGRSMTIDGVPFTIVGVTPRQFSGPEIGRRFDVIVPLEDEPLTRGMDSFLDSSGVTFLTIIARLRADQSIVTATDGIRRAQSQIREATLDDIGRFGSREAIDRYLTAPLVLSPGATGYSGARDLRVLYQRPLLTLLLVVALLLCVACVNVANLLVARAIARRHELSVRLAIGATRSRLVRQLLTESVVLYGVGAAAGFVLAMWSSRVLVSQLSTPGDTLFLDVSMDGRVLTFTLAVTVITTLIFGIWPAFHATRMPPLDSLKRQGRLAGGQGRGVLTGSLIVVQVALSLVLLVAAGLFIRTFQLLRTRPLGFEPSHVLVVNVDAHRTTTEPSKRLAEYERARDAVRALPDVADAALSLTIPVSGSQFTPSVEIAGVSNTRGPVWANLISPEWFATLQMPMLVGRTLTDHDRTGTPRVAVVNEAFARKFAAGKSPIGLTMALYPRTSRSLGPVEIVGVVGDAVYSSLRSPVPPTFYMSLAQFDYLTELGIREISLSVRSRTASPLELTRSITTAIETVDSQLSLTFRPLLGQVAASLTRERLIAQLSGIFGALTLLLAGLGLYGVTSQSVTSRRTEIAVRMALGATAARVMWQMLVRAAIPVGLGVALGTGMSLSATKLVRALIYGIDPGDRTTLVASIAVLAVVAGIAASFPARRAARTDPASVLRDS